MNTESVSDTSVPEASAAMVSSNHLLCGPWLGGGSALAGGLLTWIVVLIWFPVFNLPPELVDLPSPVPTELAVKQDLATAEANANNVTLALAIFGLLVASLLTAAEAYRRQVLSSIWWRGILAGLIAAGVGAAAGMLGATVFGALAEASLQPLLKSMAMQATMLGATGLGIGIAVSISFRSIPLVVSGACGGVLGGVFAAVLYLVVVGYLLPNSQTECLMPRDSISALAWLITTAAMSGLVLGGLGGKPARQSVDPT